MKTTLTATEVRKDIYNLIDETSISHRPITVIGKRNNAVLISEDDWRAIQETLYLISVPGMQKSIKEGMETPLSDCSDDLEW